MKSYDVEQTRYHDTDRPTIDIEKRLMFSFALFGSFSFGFVFFGEAPTILGLLLFFAPAGESMLLPKILGITGLLALGIGIWRREGLEWRPATIVGAAFLFSSWLLFYGIVGSNLMTFLGTSPFLFFSIWFLVDSVRVLGRLFQLSRLRGETTNEDSDPVMQRAKFAGFFTNLLSGSGSHPKAEKKTRVREYPGTP